MGAGTLPSSGQPWHRSRTKNNGAGATQSVHPSSPVASEDAADLASCVGLQWADPVSLLQSVLTPESRVPWLSTHKSFCVQTQCSSRSSCGEGQRGRDIAWCLLWCFHGPCPWLHWSAAVCSHRCCLVSVSGTVSLHC